MTINRSDIEALVESLGNPTNRSTMTVLSEVSSAERSAVIEAINEFGKPSTGDAEKTK